MMQKQVPGLQKDSSFLHIKQITSKHLPISLQEKNRVGKKGQGGECSKLLQLVSSLAISCTQIPMLSLSNRTKQTVLMVEDMVATKQLEMALRISWAAVCFGKPFLKDKNTHTHLVKSGQTLESLVILYFLDLDCGIHYVRGQCTHKHSYLLDSIIHSLNMEDEPS